MAVPKQSSNRHRLAARGTFVGRHSVLSTSNEQETRSHAGRASPLGLAPAPRSLTAISDFIIIAKGGGEAASGTKRRHDLARRAAVPASSGKRPRRVTVCIGSDPRGLVVGGLALVGRPKTSTAHLASITVSNGPVSRGQQIVSSATPGAGLRREAAGPILVAREKQRHLYG